MSVELGMFAVILATLMLIGATIGATILLICINARKYKRKGKQT